MDITVQQLQTYIGCPLQHQFLFLENRPIPKEEEPTLHDKIYIDLKELIEYTYIEETLGHIALESVLRNRLALMWRTKINPEQHDYKVNHYGNLLMSAEEKILKGGYDAVHRFIAWSKSRPRFRVISVHENFRVPCGRHYLVGQLPILRHAQNQFMLLDIRSSILDATISESRYMLYASWCVAFEYIYGRAVDYITILWVDRKGRNLTSKIKIHHWRKQYFKRLINQVGHAIQLRITYPLKGDRCSTCPFIKECQNWIIQGPCKPLFSNREVIAWENPQVPIEIQDAEIEEVIKIIIPL